MKLVVIGSLAGVAGVALVVYTVSRMKRKNDAAVDEVGNRRAAMAFSVTLGAAIGAGLSVVLDVNIGVGVAIGTSIGVAIGSARERRQGLR